MNWRTVALKTAIFFGVVVGLVLLAPRAQAQEDATAITRESNASVVQQLSFQDSEDFEDARRGFVATLPDATIRSADGRAVWSLKDYEFLKDKAPPTVNPSLWRVARLNLSHGLFKVTDRIYQIRGFGGVLESLKWPVFQGFPEAQPISSCCPNLLKRLGLTAPDFRRLSAFQ